MDKIVTAEEMYEISRSNMQMKKDVRVAIDRIMEEALQSAQEGKFSCGISQFGFSCSSLRNQRNMSTKQKKIIKQLKELGYRAEVCFVEEENVNIWLEVSWSHMEGNMMCSK